MKVVDVVGASAPYAHGENWSIYHGEALDLLRSVRSSSVDALVTDPPYSSGGMTRGDRSGSPRAKYCQSGSAEALAMPDFGGDNRDQRSYLLWCELWLSLALPRCKPGSIVGVWTDWRQLPTTTDALQVGGWVWRGIGTWIKSGARPQKGRISASAEYLVWGSSGALGDGNGHCARGDAWADPVVVEPSARGDARQHMTQKPDAVMEWALSVVAPGGVVLDPFAGSGSTGVAALRTGRMAIMFERDEAYCEVAARRMEQVQVAPNARGSRSGQLGLL